MLKAEIGEFSGTNTTRDAQLRVLLSNKQKFLTTEYDWEFLERHWDVPAPAGTQYLALPTTTAATPAAVTSDINFDRDVTVEVLYGSRYFPVMDGISDMEYNTFNYALNGATSAPIQRWRLATNPNETSSANQFEVWPVPSGDQVVRFTGQRTVQALASDTDKADLDDVLIVLAVAAEILLRSKQADAQLKLQLAQRRLQWLRQNYPVRKVIRTMDGRGDAGYRTAKKIQGMIIVH